MGQPIICNATNRLRSSHGAHFARLLRDTGTAGPEKAPAKIRPATPRYKLNFTIIGKRNVKIPEASVDTSKTRLKPNLSEIHEPIICVETYP